MTHIVSMHDLQLVSLQKAADLLDVHEDTVTRMLRRGDLRGTKVKGNIRVYATSIDAYQKNNEIVPVLQHNREQPMPRSRPSSAEHNAAMRSLREMGFNV